MASVTGFKDPLTNGAIVNGTSPADRSLARFVSDNHSHFLFRPVFTSRTSNGSFLLWNEVRGPWQGHWLWMYEFRKLSESDELGT